ncbi:MAG: PASTA domain-containing protein [Coriobacteriia bacterium]|nr:PASTA domain-containing protein [Coriobacteriia bacterium]MCL2537288.1 PASTA domain-containing protein [Coriobacteriia bacterium]
MSDFLRQFEEKSDPLESETKDEPKVKGRRAIAKTAHKTRRDKGYDKKKIVRYLAIASSVAAVCLLAFGIFYFSQRVELRDFVGSNVTEARTWAIQNRITIEERAVYSLDYDSDIVVSQDRAPDSKINRGSVLRLEVSRGPDMTEHVELPDFASMRTAEVRQWRQDVRAINSSIVEEYSTEVEQTHFIRLEFTNVAVNADNYTRADGLLIYMSKGKEVFEANITVPDFLDRSPEEARQWARENGIELTIEEDSHDSVMAGHISAQSIAAGQRLARHDEMTITLSLGRAIIVPNFSRIPADEASYPGLDIVLHRRFNTSVAFGRLISQSISAGTELTGDGHRITLVYSLGRPYIENLIGEPESRLAEYFHVFRAGGASITYTTTYVDSHEPKGTIVGMSRFAQFVSMNENIRIQVSRGNLTPPLPPANEGE